ncbi:hypothetical protein HKX48_003045 [Thoreauomyces humboldtii]|nr:hypothetical protein HKX48_003045 [Thoreauomyces humboldtii]
MEIFLTMAAVVRFAHVITKTKHRKMFQRGLCVTLLLYGCVLGVQAGREIAASVTQPTIFSRVFIGLFFVPIIVYLIGGLFCFSWNLPSKFQSSSSSAGPDQTFTLLKTLRITNDVMMGLVIALCISELGLVFPLRTSNYNNPVVCLHVTIILFIENVFETVTNGLRGRGVFSGYTSDRPSELSNMRRDELPHPFRSEIGQVAPEVYQPPTASYAGRESWAFGNGGAHTGKSGTGRY